MCTSHSLSISLPLSLSLCLSSSLSLYIYICTYAYLYIYICWRSNLTKQKYPLRRDVFVHVLLVRHRDVLVHVGQHGEVLLVGVPSLCSLVGGRPTSGPQVLVGRTSSDLRLLHLVCCASGRPATRTSTCSSVLGCSPPTGGRPRRPCSACCSGPPLSACALVWAGVCFVVSLFVLEPKLMYKNICK